MGIINKKSFKFLVIFFSFIMSLVFSTKVYAADIKATNITLIDKSSTAEVDTPVMVNNEITSKITLNKENDYAVFDLTIKNNEKNKYKIESIIDNNENEYITVNYDYSKDYFEEETKVKIKFLYKNKLINHDKVSMNDLKITINLINDKGESTNIIINNPKTGDNISLYLIVLILGVLGIIYTKKKIDFKGIKIGISVLIFTILLLPFAIFAIDRYEIPITFKGVEAKGEFEVYDVMVEGIGIRQVTYGNEIGELPEQARDGYSFNGYEDENGVAVSSDTIVTGPKTIKPMYTIITYTITYDYNGGYATNPETYTVENTITLNNPTKKGYTFSGWTGSNGDALQTEVTINSLTGDLNYVANYSANTNTAYKVIHRYPNLDGTYNEEVENLTGATDSTVRPQTRDKTGFTSPELQDIVINAEGTSEIIYTYTRNNYNLTLTDPEYIESVFTSGSYPYETEITVKAKEKQGYTFSKWSNNETAKEYTFKLLEDTELYPMYTPNTDTPYTVIHKTMNLDGTTYTVKNTENLTGTTDTNVTPGVKTYEGFTSPETKTVKIKGDGSTVVEYLYTRNKYTLNIEDKDKIVEDKSGEYFYGTEITLEAKDIPGYTFTGWENGGNEKTYTFNLTEDKEIKPTYTANTNTPYTVIHKKMNLDGTTYTVAETENLTGVTDTNVTPNVKTYTGFTSPSTQTVKIKGDGSTVVEYLYERNRYTLNIEDKDKIEEDKSGEYYYGTEITVVAKDISGYVFTGWENGGNEKTYTFNLTEDKTIKPIYTAGDATPYTVVHKTMNLDGTTYTVEETENLTGVTDTNVTPNVKTYTGFTSPSTQTVKVKGDGSTVVEYLYTRNKYTLNIEDKDKIVEDKSGEYFYGTEITVEAKDISGYVFTGWENGGNEKTYTFNLTEDKEIKPLYTANTNTPYTVIHKTMNLDGTTYTVKDTENLTGTTDTNVTPNVKTYTGFTSPETKTVKIKGDGSTKVEYLYTRNKYALTYVDNDNIDLPNSTAPGEYYYGKEITIKAKEKEGYTFKQWSTGETENPLTVILGGELVINPEYTPNKYNIVFNSNTGTGTMDNEEMTYDVEKALSKNLYTKPGYVFKGWNTKEDKTGTHYNDEAIVKNLVTSGNITLYAEWIEAQAMFSTGQNVNAQMKKLAGNSSATYTTEDTNITSIQKSSTKPDISTMTSDNIVSISYSTYNTPIYMWYDSGTIYWWSEDSTPCLNNDSSNMFRSLKNATNIELNSFNTSNVTNIGNMFYDCRNLTTLDLGDKFDTSNVTNMENMFYDCISLTTLDLGDNFNTSNVTNMSGMFVDCRNLTTLDLGDKFDTSNVNSMSQMFNKCSGLTGLDLGDKFDTSNVTNMNSMFSYCRSLTSLDLGDKFDTSNVTNMRNLFLGCSNLTSLDLGDKFDTSNVTDMGSMFSGCSNLTSLDLGDKFDTSKVTDMGLMFSKCGKLTSLDLGDKFDTNNVTNMNSMFSSCSSLTGIDLGDKFDTSNVTDMHYMFINCSGLTTLDLGDNFDTSKVTDMHDMFSSCSSLTGIDLGDNFDTSKVTDMGWMFSKCSNLTSLDLGDKFDTSNVKKMYRMFSGCYNLKTIYATDDFVTSEVTDSFYMFTDDIKLVGGMGTTFSSSHVDKEYAHLDGGISNPGYFTNKESINISFNANGGEGTMDVQTVPYNVATALNENTFTREGYIFDGWNTKADGTGTDYADKESVTLTTYTSLYAKWKEKVATLDTGQNVNAKLKKLAGNTYATFYSYDTNITSIQRTSIKPDISTMTNDNIISTSDSTVPVYAWYDNGIIYYYSDQETIRMNSDSSNLFNNFDSMESVDLSNLDTSKVTNMLGMFYRCSSLTNIDVTNFDTSNVTNMYSMFYGCNSLTNLDVRHFNTSNVTNMKNMFRGCSSLTSIDVTNFDTSNVTNMSSMFGGCSGLTSIDVTNFDTSNVTDMSSMFGGCYLTSLDLSHFDTSNVTNMSSMFVGCEKLTSLNISHFDTSNVTNMSGMFGGCSGLTSLDLSHFDTSNVTDMSAMFTECKKLTSLNISHFDTSNVTNMSNMFDNCKSLTSLDLSHFDTSKVTNMSSMFSKCSSLTSLDVTHFNTVNVTNMGGMFHYCNALTSLDVTNFDTSNVTDMNAMFTLCENLTQIDVSHFDTSNVTNMNSIFEGCSSLTSLDFSHFDTSKVTDMSAMFRGCEKLTELDVSHFDTSNVKYMIFMFSTCKNITSLDLSNFNTSQVKKMSYMFDSCSSLTTLDLSSFDTSKVTHMEKMFYNDYKLTTIYASNRFVTTNVTISNEMFKDMSSDLKGGSGTTWSSSNPIDVTYARIDDPDNGNPGYFTYKAYSGPTGGNISKVSNMIKNNGNKIVLFSSAILIIILSIVLKLVNRKKKSS